MLPFATTVVGSCSIRLGDSMVVGDGWFYTRFVGSASFLLQTMCGSTDTGMMLLLFKLTILFTKAFLSLYVVSFCLDVLIQ